MSLVIRTLRDTRECTNSGIFTAYGTQKAAFEAEINPVFEKIETVISQTNALGRLPLWEGYQDLKNYGRKIGKNAKRSIFQVRTGEEICRFYTWLVVKMRPKSVVEFGAALGASGMYWLAGLTICDSGMLHSFEPNSAWCPIARRNFAAIGERFVLTEGTFEANSSLIESEADITLIDAIHTRQFVLDQFEIVKSVSRPGALVIFDDINFSPDMKDCWQEIANVGDFPGVWQLGNRVGIVELS